MLKVKFKLGIVAHTYNLSTLEAEGRGYSEFKVNLDHIVRPSLKKLKGKRKGREEEVG